LATSIDDSFVRFVNVCDNELDHDGRAAENSRALNAVLGSKLTKVAAAMNHNASRSNRNLFYKS
jgi:hypothetical protein